jgi:acyl-CoA dehydrogenase
MKVQPIPNMVNHETNELFFDDLEIPAENLIGRRAKGFKYYPDRSQRRADADRCRMHRRRLLVHRQGHEIRQRAGRVRPADRPEPGRAVPDRRGLHRTRGREPDALRVLPPLRRASTERGPGEHGQAPRGQGLLEAANACLQFHGGFGFANEYDVERKFRETRLYQVAPISTNLILAYVAEHLLGLPRSF